MGVGLGKTKGSTGNQQAGTASDGRRRGGLNIFLREGDVLLFGALLWPLYSTSLVILWMFGITPVGATPPDLRLLDAAVYMLVVGFITLPFPALLAVLAVRIVRGGR